MHIDTTVDQSFGPVGKTMSSSSLRGSSICNASMGLDEVASSVLIGTVAELIGTVAARGLSVTVSEAIAALHEMRRAWLRWKENRLFILSQLRC